MTRRAETNLVLSALCCDPRELLFQKAEELRRRRLLPAFGALLDGTPEECVWRNVLLALAGFCKFIECTASPVLRGLAVRFGLG